jgi:urea transport system permease protein
MYLTLENRPAGTKLPSFMALYGNYTELPWLWRPFQNLWFTLAAAVVVPTIIAGLLGFLVFKRRIRGPYFALLTQASVVVFVLTIRGNLPLTAGVNGLTGFTEVFGHHNYKTRTANYIVGTNKFFYYVAAAALLVVILLAFLVVSSRFGKVLQASKESEDRVRFLGYDPAIIKTVAFMIAAAFAGLAGAIFAPVIGIVQPNRFDVVPSILMVCWVAVGGRGRIWGAVVGAILVNYLATHVSESNPDDWQYYQGLLFVVVLAFVPAGLIGLPRAIYEKGRNLVGGRSPAVVQANVESLEVTG